MGEELDAEVGVGGDHDGVPAPGDDLAVDGAVERFGGDAADDGDGVAGLDLHRVAGEQAGQGGETWIGHGDSFLVVRRES